MPPVSAAPVASPSYECDRAAGHALGPGSRSHRCFQPMHGMPCSANDARQSGRVGQRRKWVESTPAGDAARTPVAPRLRDEGELSWLLLLRANSGHPWIAAREHPKRRIMIAKAASRRSQPAKASTTEKKLPAMGVTAVSLNPAWASRSANSCSDRSLPPRVTIISRSMSRCG